MKRVLLLCVVFCCCCLTLSAQKKIYHPFSGSFALSLEGVGTVSNLTDYSQIVPDYGGRAMLEYFLPLYSKSIFGFRGGIDAGYLHGKKPALSSAPYEFRTNITSFDGGLIYGLSINETIFPYVFAGVSYLRFDPRDASGNALPNNKLGVYSKTELDYTAELGFRFLLTDNLSINVGGAAHVSPRDYLDDLKYGSGNDIYLSGFVGFSFTFFNSKDSDGDGVPDDKDLCPDTPAGIRVDIHGCPIDSDHDGVPDYLDECPGTPEGVKVNKKGCPLDSDGDGVPDYLDLCPGTPQGVAVDENGCPKDSDGDGVPDYLDKCPNTPKGAPVDQFGCPLDSDGDGVPDYLDKCPNTPKGVQVDSCGCPLQLPQIIKEVPVIKEVTKEVVLNAGASFQAGRSVLLPAAYPDLDKLVQFMKDNPRSKWVIEGHTDNTGAPASNKKLSLARAQAVLKYFTSKGVGKDRFTVRGMGSDYPVASNATEEGRLKNRRVVIVRAN
jgi:outer membrane protein OmpA-like peptidoglycan-associated protein/opacity protein-like surface antigen